MQIKLLLAKPSGRSRVCLTSFRDLAMPAQLDRRVNALFWEVLQHFPRSCSGLIREPKGFGRIRLRRIENMLLPFICEVIEPGAKVHITPGCLSNAHRVGL
jgi:hypothetical protein